MKVTRMMMVVEEEGKVLKACGIQVSSTRRSSRLECEEWACRLPGAGLRDAIATVRLPICNNTRRTIGHHLRLLGRTHVMIIIL